jgi:hypothetical protein
MKFFKRGLLLVMAVSLALVFIGCAKPPEEEKAAAKAAMDAAVAANAGKFVAADFEAAMKLWGTAEAQVGEKKYEEAKQGYINAKAAFEKATTDAAAKKKTLTDEATAAVAGLEEGWKALDATAKDLEKKIGDKKEAWEADAKAYADGLKAAKDMIAKDPIGAKAKTVELKAVIDKWDAAFKEMAAAPAPKKGKK